MPRSYKTFKPSPIESFGVISDRADGMWTKYGNEPGAPDPLSSVDSTSGVNVSDVAAASVAYETPVALQRIEEVIIDLEPGTDEPDISLTDSAQTEAPRPEIARARNVIGWTVQRTVKNGMYHRRDDAIFSW